MQKSVTALRAALVTVQRFVATHRTLLTLVFVLFEALTLSAWAVVFWFAKQGNFSAVSEFVFFTGNKLGEISLLLYISTLMPGILLRLRWWPEVTAPVSSIVLQLRKHLGILMFLTAFVHMGFSATIPQLVFVNFDLSRVQLQGHAIFGMLAWWCLLPLWLTSNDVSVRILGTWWKRLHRLTYCAMLLIFTHVALQFSNWAVVLGLTVILEIVSHFVAYQRAQQLRGAIS